MPSASGRAPRSLNGTTPSGPASPTPMTLGPLNTPPLAYQSMPKCGTLGGAMLKLPEMDRCGSFRWGSDHEKLKNPLMESMTLRTVSRAFCIGVSMALLMEFHTLLTVSLAALNTLEIVSRIPFTMPDMVELMPPHTLDAVLLTAPHMESHTA